VSTQITTAFVQQFSNNIQMLSQQTGSLFRNAVREESITGEKAFFEQLGSTAAIKKTSRHGDTPLVHSQHDRRQVVTETYEWADLIDDSDKVRLLISPESTYAKSAAAAMSRSIDDAIITAATGTANTGKSGSTSVSLTNTIAAGGTGLTLAKLIEAKKKLDLGNVDPSISRYIAVSPEQIEDLLNSTTVTSSDYNSVKALVSGDIDTFLGFKFILTNRLSISGSDRKCFAWAEDGILLATGMNLKTEISTRADKSYSTQVFCAQDIGSTRMEEAKVVSIDCQE